MFIGANKDGQSNECQKVSASWRDTEKDEEDVHEMAGARGKEREEDYKD